MTTFFERLKQETMTERAELLSIPFIAEGAAGRLGLDSYIAFLTQAYHHVKHTTPLLMACGARVPHEAEWLRNAMAHYISEEIGHQEWILDDLVACGMDREAIRNGEPEITTELMVAYAYDLVQRVNPVGLLGMVLVLEGTSIQIALAAADKIQAALGLPDLLLETGRTYGSLDVSHMQFFEEVVNKLDSEADRLCVIHAAKVFYRLYGDIFRALPRQRLAA